MKSTAVVFVLTFLINIGILFLGINCTTLGLISPIEVVEEWGCHDTEIRLTCGHLDSKLAILEATFTPNCTDPDCLRIDLRRLVKVFSPQKSADPRAAEAEAGRKFLETLRKTHAEDDSTDDADGGESSIDGEGGPKADRLIAERARKASLRVSLERLIIRYLRELSPDEDFNFQVKRSYRSRREVPVTNNNATEMVAIGERNITINESDTSVQDRENERLQRLQKARTYCPEQRRKVSSLDRYDIERAFKNETEDEYNIRRIINRRCSGKNHCSFLFNIDHPFTQVWDSGIVRVKYLCMEDFRANHYCGEHFTIGYEVAPEIRTAEPPRGEPIAEARTQLKEPGLHSLKIIKTSDDVDEEPGLKLITSTDSRKRKIKVQQPTQEEVQKAAGVYSQDFRVLKILPSNLDDFNDIEKIGDEIYFRTNDKTLDGPESEPDPEPTASTQSRHTTREISTTQDSGLPSSQPTPEYVEKSWEAPVIPNEIEDDIAQPEEPKRNYTKFENITLTIREGEQYSFTYPRPRTIDNLMLNTSTYLPSSQPPPPAPVNISATEVSPSVSTSPETFLEPPLGPPENISTRLFELIEKEIEVSPTADEDLSAEGSDREYDSVGGGNRIIEDVDSFYDDDLDNDSDEDDDDDRISYSSIQRTFYGRPLLHGFTMTPGYPKYYIGDSECKWELNAPSGQKIRLNILDISLRYDEECKDFVEIIDLAIGRPLFNSCTEAIRPLEIISDTNKVEVIVKTTTKFAYPKRGVLIHYSALGCIDPPPPKNGRLINRTETTASFVCDPSFVFPDSGVNRRQLVCSNKHSWDRILPDCVEELAVAGSGFISGLNLNSHKRPPDGTSKPAEMSDKEADLVYDIIIPLILIGGLFIINAIIFVVILRYRRRNKSLEGDNVELAEL